MTQEVLNYGITLDQFNSLQALAGLDGCFRLVVPWEVASELDEVVPLLYLMQFLRQHGAGKKDTPYSRLLEHLEDLFFEMSGL